LEGNGHDTARAASMVRIRHFRNDDPPALVALWNDSVLGRGAYTLRSAVPLERHVFSKPYFDPQGLLIAVDNERPVGFAHAGFGPNETESALDRSRGVLCAIVVHPDFRRRGLGSALLHAAETYVLARGTNLLHAGPHWPLCPFYFGLYGGSGLPGFLVSDEIGELFLTHHGYEKTRSTVVFQRRLDQAVVATDPRFANLRRRYELRITPTVALGSWWQECVLGMVEPVEVRLEERFSRQPVARAPVWEMDGYAGHWNTPTVGVTDIQVRSDLRRQGLAKLLVTQLLKTLQEQCYGIVEVQTLSNNDSALPLFQSLGFQQVDRGQVYRKTIG
jgi:ribosomal protein S18 acetylase RimI-like enzyme